MQSLESLQMDASYTSEVLWGAVGGQLGAVLNNLYNGKSASASMTSVGVYASGSASFMLTHWGMKYAFTPNSTMPFIMAIISGWTNASGTYFAVVPK